MYFINSSDNAKIAVYDLNKNGYKTIVLIHGWPLSHRMFEYQIPILISNGYRVITMDIRGFGNSEETTFGYNYDQFAIDLYYIISALKLKEFDLLGFSMGGAIATRYMNIYNGYGVRTLCLLDAAVPSYCKSATNPYGQSIEDTNILIDLGYNDRPKLNEYFGSIFFNKEHSKPFLNYIQIISDFSSGIGQMKSLIALRDEDCFEDLKHIKVKTGIFHGKKDKVCPFEMAQITHNNIQNSELFSFEDGGHGTFYDEKDAFNNTLIKFLS